MGGYQWKWTFMLNTPDFQLSLLLFLSSNIISTLFQPSGNLEHIKIYSFFFLPGKLIKMKFWDIKTAVFANVIDNFVDKNLKYVHLTLWNK